LAAVAAVARPRLRVFDSLSREVLPVPLSEGGRELKLYVCGVTPYDSGHLGHAFTFCAFDVLVRWLEAQGVGARYVQNVTDVDDPLFERARRDSVRWDELAAREVVAFVADMDALGWRRPDAMPRVSGEIPGILDAVRELDRRGFAYQSDSVYFEVAGFPSYGALSHRSRRSMLRKLREEGLLGRVGPGGKRDALDFPLWRPSLDDEPAWESEYGAGRPGWHIECSSMAMRYLGPVIDVHGGGRDLAFSHHESERAQSQSLTGRDVFARAWMHTGMVRYEGRKMSKSLGNLVVVRQCLQRAPAAAVRLYLASHRYRRDWTFRWEGLDRAATRAARAGPRGGEGGGGGAGPGGAVRGGGAPEGASRELVARFTAAMDDDLDTPSALRALRQAVRVGDAPAAAWMTGMLCGTASLT